MGLRPSSRPARGAGFLVLGFRRRLPAAALVVVVLLAAAGAALTTAQRAEAAACNTAAVTVTPMHSPDGVQRPFYADFGRSSTNHSGYVGYELNGASLGSDLWIKLSGFAGGSLGLATNQSAVIPARATSQAGKPLVYAYLTASAATASAQTFTVEIWNGKPNQAGSTQVCTTTDGFSAVEDVINAAANKITSIAVSNSSPAIGGTFDVTAVGDTGQMGAGLAADQSGGNGVFSMAPAMDDAWPADAFTLTGVRTTLGGTTHRDRLRIYPGSAAAGAYTSRYDFTVRTTTSGATRVLPVQSIASGTQVKYTGTYPGTISQISPPAITVSLAKTALSVAGPPYTIDYQVVVSNTAASAVTLDYLRDTPTPAGPANWTFEAGSAKLGGNAIPDPTLDGGVLVFAGPFSVPASGSLVFTYTLAVSTAISNSVVGTVGGTDIGASSGTANQVSVDPTAPVVTTATLPNATVSSPYSQTLAASGGTGSYTWSVTSGSLPAGLALAAATGVIAGTPTGAGASTFTVTATDGTPSSGSTSLTLTVDAAAPPPGDTTAPTGSLTLDGGAAVTSSTNVAVGLSATDAVGVVAYRLAEGSGCTSASWVAVASAASFAGAASLTVSAGDGTKTVCVQYQDAAGNVSTAATATIALDATRPAATLASVAPPSVGGAFVVTATFSEAVTGFTAGDVTTGNGTVSGFGGSGTSYSFTITPVAEGAVTVDVAAGAAADAAGNTSTAATQLSRTYDLTPPTASLASSAAALVGGAFTVTVTFSESVTGFDASDVTIGNGSLSGFAGSGAGYSFTVTPVADGPVTVDVGAGAGADATGSGSGAAAQLARTADVTQPSVSLATSAPSSTNGAFLVTATFSEPVTGFTALDVAVANGVVSGFAGGGAVYTFTVTPTGAGAVEVGVPGGTASEDAGNGNAAATPLIRLFDPVAPVVALSETTAASTVAGSASFTFAADEPVSFSCSLDAATFDPCASPLVLTGLAAGDHTLVIRVLDAAGNRSDRTYTWAVAAPSEPPSAARVPQPHVLIIPKINPTDMLGRPRGFKQSTDGARSPGPFTRKLQVKLHIPTPSGDGIHVDDVFISNHADFRGVVRYPVATDELYDWELLAGPSGDRRVYIRFDAAPDALVGEATIVLDQELPELKPTPMRRAPRVERRPAASRPVYCGAAPRRWLRLPGADGFSGLNAVQIATDVRHPCGWRPYLPTISYRAPGKVLYVRIEDRVGNISRWYRVVTR